MLLLLFNQFPDDVDTTLAPAYRYDVLAAALHYDVPDSAWRFDVAAAALSTSP